MSTGNYVHYPSDLARTLNETVDDKKLKYLAVVDKNTVSLCDFYFWRLIGKPTDFFATSGVQLPQTNLFCHRHTELSTHLKSKVGNILTKASALRIQLNIDDTTIASRSPTHPSHSQTSRLFSSSLPWVFQFLALGLSIHNKQQQKKCVRPSRP